MSNSKYDAYLKIGAALKNGDEKKASDIARIIIKSDRQYEKDGVIFAEKVIISRHDKRLLK